MTGVPEIREGDDLTGIILGAAEAQGTPVEDGDILVVTQKVVSKSEGAIVRLEDVEPSPLALTIAGDMKDPRHVEVVLRESRRIVRMERGVLITETHHGLVCANAGRRRIKRARRGRALPAAQGPQRLCPRDSGHHPGSAQAAPWP